MSNRIQNTLIDAVVDVIRNDSKKEISAAPFVAVEVDETTDVLRISVFQLITSAFFLFLFTQYVEKYS